MGDGGNRKYGLLQDLLLIVVSVSFTSPKQPYSTIRTTTECYFPQSFSMYYIAKSVVSSLPLGNDPEKEQHEQARVKAAANLRRLDKRRGEGDSDSEDDSDRSRGKPRRTKKEDLVLDQYESQIALEVVSPEDISVGFDGRTPMFQPPGIAKILQILEDSTTS